MPKEVPPVVPKPVSFSVLGSNLDRRVVTSLRLPVVLVPPNVLPPNAEGCGVVAPNADGAGEPNEKGVVKLISQLLIGSIKIQNCDLSAKGVVIYTRVLR